MKEVFSKYRLVTFFICAIVIDFISIYCYFYFGLHYFVPKYLPVIIAGTIGFILLKKNWIANLGFCIALITFCYPLLSQDYVIARALIILQFIEVLIIYNGVFTAALMITGCKRGQKNLKKALPFIINTALAIFLMAFGSLSLLTNILTADMYVDKKYNTSGFERVSAGFSPSGLHGHYIFGYRNKDGIKLNIETEGIYVFFDSIKGNA